MFAWLLTEAGQRTLEAAGRAYDESAGDPVGAATTLRRTSTGLDPGLDPGHAAAALTQVGLRSRARSKFGDDADRMYFTPEGLEQATRAPVAQHRARRLALARPASVLDLGCGVGGDLVAFAATGLTCAGVDRDPVHVAMARANLAALGLGGAVQQAEGADVDLDRFGAVYADPARRTASGRVFDAEGWSPPWSFVEGLLTTRTAVVKVAPGLPHRLVPEGVEAEWVSDGGEVKEASLWSAPLASARRRATVIGRGGLATLTEEDDPGSGVRDVGRYVYEPDGAVIRAGLVTAVAAGVHGGLLDEHIAYVSGDESFQTPFARGYEVLETLPFREKQLRAALRARHVGRLTIKKRGVQVVPEELRARLSLRGDAEATVILTRVSGKGTALLVRPLAPSRPPDAHA